MSDLTVSQPQIAIFGDGFDLKQIKNRPAVVSGFTSNPSLFRKLNIMNYLDGCRSMVTAAEELPISLEVLSESQDDIVRQAVVLSELGKNVFVKIPIVASDGTSLIRSIEEVTKKGINVNVTAVFTPEQIDSALSLLKACPGNHYLSIFAGRIADTGRDPSPIVRYAVNLTRGSAVKVIWASPREVFNVRQADECGCDIITCPAEITRKLELFGKNLSEFSRETSQMFANDAREAGYSL